MSASQHDYFLFTLIPLTKAIADLPGRSYDRFKRSMAYLNAATLGKFYRFPPTFFWQLASLCRFGKNSRLNLRLLVNTYDKAIVIPERIKWN